MVSMSLFVNAVADILANLSREYLYGFKELYLYFFKNLSDEVYLSCLDFAKNNLKFYNPHKNFIIFVKRARIESPYRSATQTLTLFTLAKSNAAQTKGQFFKTAFSFTLLLIVA